MKIHAETERPIIPEVSGFASGKLEGITNIVLKTWGITQNRPTVVL